MAAGGVLGPQRGTHRALVQYIVGFREPDPSVGRRKSPIQSSVCEVAVVVRRGREGPAKIAEPTAVSAAPVGCQYSGSF